MESLVSPSELIELTQHGTNTVIVDCRFSLADPAQGETSYHVAHIPGAVYLHLNRDLSGPVEAGVTGRHPLPDVHALVARLQEVGISSDSTVIAYDADHGAFAARLWWLLRWLGHDAVAVLDGGLARWIAEGHPVVAEVERVQPGRFFAQPRQEMIVPAEAVEEMREREDSRLFDARNEDRFRGENETIDPVAGHIPGARSLPFMQNLAEGRFREREQLRRRFEQALGGVSPKLAVVYCGSGVTACHHVLAAEFAGFKGLRLYPGSWSEWITDPTRPTDLGSESAD